MLPSIALVDSVEMIRDGGSLAAVFQGSNGSRYWLFIKIDVEILASGEWQRTHYLKPIVYERPHGAAVELSWQHAKVFLNQMRWLLQTQRHEGMLEIMMTVIDAKGKKSYEEVVAQMEKVEGPTHSYLSRFSE
jgi:hypothetical protein